MGFWPFRQKGEGVELATRIVSAMTRDGVAVRGKLTLRFALHETRAGADEVADRLGSLVEAILREAPASSELVGREADVLGVLEARLPSNMPATRSIELAALHVVGGPGSRPSGEWAHAASASGPAISVGRRERPSASGPSSERGASAAVSAPVAAFVPVDDDAGSLDLSFDAIELDTRRRPLQAAADGSPVDSSMLDLHPNSQRCLDGGAPKPAVQSVSGRSGGYAASVWPPPPPSGPQPDDSFPGLGSQLEMAAPPAPPSAAVKSSQRGVPAAVSDERAERPRAPASRPSAQGGRADSSPRRQALVAGLDLPVGSSPEAIGAALSTSLRDAAGRLLVGALGAIGKLEPGSGDEVARLTAALGEDAVDLARHETAVCATYLSYAGMLWADVPQNIVFEVLQVACAAAFPRGKSPLAAIRRYVSSSASPLADQLAAQLGNGLGAAVDAATLAEAVTPLVASVDEDLRAAARLVKAACGL